MTLRHWFTRVLEGSGVTASPGSARAASASAAIARGVTENDVMQAVDWASSRTMYANYIWVLPSSVLSASSLACSVKQAPKVVKIRLFTDISLKKNREENPDGVWLDARIYCMLVQKTPS